MAMLTVAREIGQHIYNGVLHKEDFKIIYVAPMKALAAEVVEKFGSRLSKLGITVKELTGDMQLTKQELSNTQVRWRARIAPVWRSEPGMASGHRNDAREVGRDHSEEL